MTASNLDPRSPEFIDMLQKLSTAIAFVVEHPEILDAEKYRQWLDKLQTRAVSLIGRAMRDLLDVAGKKCRDVIQQKLYATRQQESARLGEEQPLESTPIYQKFRGLSYRMKELSHVLFEGGLSRKDTVPGASDPSPRSSSLTLHGHHHVRKHHEFRSTAKVTLSEVKRTYAALRVELLLPFIREAWMSALLLVRTPLSSSTIGASGTNLVGILEDPKQLQQLQLNSKTVNNSRNANPNSEPLFLSLSVALRQVFSILVRVAQLEHQLFDSLFALSLQGDARTGSYSATSTPRHVLPPAAVSVSRASSFRSTSGNINNNIVVDTHHIEELVLIVEAAANATRDFLRPLIIKESSVDELCRVIAVLSEDMHAQVTILPAPNALLTLLLQSLDTTVNDAKERLTYCAETKLRLEVQLFEPLPSHVAYPDILETLEEKKKRIANNSNTSNNHNSDNNEAETITVQDIYQTWYPPMRQTLSLLSKLYGVVVAPVFEDFARRSIEACIVSLRHGADHVKRRHTMIHGDLFLVRHLLLLREQLVPFEIRLQSIEKQLDFSNTGQAFTELVVQSTRSLFRWDTNNGFLLFAQQGLPQMQELHTDAKKELDQALRRACLAFKVSAVKLLLGPLDAFLAKVAAFLGEIPYNVPSTNSNNGNSNNHHNSTVNNGESTSSLMRTSSSDVQDHVTSSTTPTHNSEENHSSSNGNGSSSSGSHGNSNGTSNNRRLQQAAVLSSEARALLKNQSFVRPERMLECLEQVQALLVQKMPDVLEMLRLYIDSVAARAILQKSIVQEFDIARRKMVSISILWIV